MHGVSRTDGTQISGRKLSRRDGAGVEPFTLSVYSGEGYVIAIHFCQPEMSFSFGSGEVPGGLWGHRSGPLSEAAISEVEDTCRIDFIGFERVRAFEDVVVVFEGDVETILFEEGHPVFATVARA